ncbi:S8 family peptidase [Bradyrhizobium brasilense]|uniref:S8 family peptidase n=1 Tax=Bradyrhizobium brasilense TaxID=1419277 RepID=UPI0024B1A021|nr:S8 family peptidase [Bradyrhizobium australafricanum]WFU31298.1 S8 family peptidase [Bradyrhizobium australafricanum]
MGNGFYESPGIILAFESDPDFPLAFESLELRKSGIELLSVITADQNRTIATVIVPDNKITRFIKVLEAYRDAVPGKRDNKKLVESIANIKLATLRELWTDDPVLYPPANTNLFWEVWLRSAQEGEDPLARMREAAGDFGYEVISNELRFVDRTVVLVRGTREQLSRSAGILGVIAEVRKARATADLYSTRSAADQTLEIEDTLARLTPASAGSPVVGLLDTGVNRGHPLLAAVISDNDAQTLKQAWGAHDGNQGGHGTQMAGLALYGDLTEVLAGDGPVELTHGLQSLKLIHPADPHDPDLYGAVTIEGVSRLEVDTTRRKIYCMAITTTDGLDRGRPSSWSAAIDNLAFGTINDTPRMILISAGNTGLDERADYPESNETSPVHDPAQAWNALTVGGYTDRALIDADSNPGWTALAKQGDLAPGSTTSVTWPRSGKTPLKPDIVMEAGNMGLPPDASDPDFLPELQLLTTNYVFEAGRPPLAEFRDTSAATALAANLACQVAARYPDYRPETIRALMVHSARWTDAMRDRVGYPDGSLDTTRLLRTFGYGVPDREMLFYSAQNNLTLIAEETIQPFFLDEEDSAVKSRDINYHHLPWPQEALEALPFDTPIEMRVTLSYFIEPSPGERGWDRKYGYPSHGLRFKVIRPTETLQQFKLRINSFDRDEDYDEDHAGETGRWELGTGKPTNGSLHSNTWHGTAAELARRGHIAVHPTLGWWRTRKKEGRYERSVHYSLVVSILAPRQDVDIYTPVAVQIGTAVPIEI